MNVNNNNFDTNVNHNNISDISVKQHEFDMDIEHNNMGVMGVWHGETYAHTMITLAHIETFIIEESTALPLVGLMRLGGRAWITSKP